MYFQENTIRLAISDIPKKFDDKQIVLAKNHADEHETELKELKSKVDESMDRIKDLERRNAPVFVVSRSGKGIAHRIATNHVDERPVHWKTVCGWAYANSDFQRRCKVDEFHSDRLCDKCFFLKIVKKSKSPRAWRGSGKGPGTQPGPGREGGFTVKPQSFPPGTRFRLT